MRWPSVSLSEKTVYLSVTNSIANLVGYPHGKEQALLRYVREGPAKIRQLGNKLKGLELPS